MALGPSEKPIAAEFSFVHYGVELHSCCVCRMAESCRIMLKQVAYNVFIGTLAVPILFELQHGLLKTGFSRRTPPTQSQNMPDRCGNVRRDRLTFELFQAEDGFEEFASSILAAKWKEFSPLFYLFILVLWVVLKGRRL